MLLIHSMSQHKHNFNFFANFLISNATDATDDDVINDVINTYAPHHGHGRRHRLIRRHSRRVTPMILSRERAPSPVLSIYTIREFFAAGLSAAIFLRVEQFCPSHRAAINVIFVCGSSKATKSRTRSRNDTPRVSI